MQCKKVQELLKADYLDGEVSLEQKRDIMEHLARCPECHRLEEELKAQRMLFQETRQEVPERVWHNIRDAIVAEGLNQEANLREGFFARLKKYLFAPQPVFVLARTLTVIIFVGFLAGVIIQQSQFFTKENIPQSDSIVYGLNGENEVVLYGLGTDIEEYFL